MLLVLLLMAAPVAAQELPVQLAFRVTSEDFSYLTAFAYDQVALYAYDATAKQIFVHDRATGRRLRVIGRPGKGPGEFTNVRAIGFVGDTLWAVDAGNARTLLLVDGREVASAPSRYTAPATGAALPMALAMALFRDGGVAVQQTGDYGRMAAGAVSSLPVYRTGRQANAQLMKLFDVDVRNRAMAIRPPGIRPETGGMFRDQPMFDGELVSANSTAIYRLNLATYTLDKFAPDGSNLWAYRGTVHPRKPRVDAVVDSFHTWYATDYERFGASSPEMLRRMILDGLYVPEREPPVARLVVGNDGTVWVQRFYAAGATVTWDIISNAGKYVGSVMLPPNVRLFAAEQREAFGVLRDEDDVPSLVKYTIGRAARAQASPR